MSRAHLPTGPRLRDRLGRLLIRALSYQPPYWLNAGIDVLWILFLVEEAVRGIFRLATNLDWWAFPETRAAAFLVPVYVSLAVVTTRRRIREHREWKLEKVREVMES